MPGTKWWELATQQGIVDPDTIDWATLNLRVWVEGHPVFTNAVPPQRLRQLWEEYLNRARNLWDWRWQWRMCLNTDGRVTEA